MKNLLLILTLLLFVGCGTDANEETPTCEELKYPEIVFTDDGRMVKIPGVQCLED